MREGEGGGAYLCLANNGGTKKEKELALITKLLWKKNKLFCYNIHYIQKSRSYVAFVIFIYFTQPYTATAILILFFSSLG